MNNKVKMINALGRDGAWVDSIEIYKLLSPDISKKSKLSLNDFKSKIVNDGNVEVLSAEEVDLFIPEKVDVESEGLFEEELSEEEFYNMEYNKLSEYERKVYYCLARYKKGKIEKHDLPEDGTFNIIKRSILGLRVELNGFDGFASKQFKFYKSWKMNRLKNMSNDEAELIADSAFLRFKNGETLNDTQLHYLSEWMMYR